MSLLPQRRKSAEEIAQLRDSLGIPVPGARVEKDAAKESPKLPSADAFDLKPGNAFVDDFSFVPAVDIGSPAAPTAPVSTPAPEPVVAKLEVKEAEPEPEKILVAPPAPITSPTPQEHATGEGKIPSQKRSVGEIERLRRQMAFAQLEPVYDPRLQKAHPFLVALGYIPVLVAVLIAHYYDQPMIVTAPFVAVSLLVALIILLRKPISRHHAGFIFAICFLVIAFGILHYFPQLQHAS